MVFTDRDRIARDLSDIVSWRSIGAGLGIQGLQRFFTDQKASERIGAVTAELDETIRALRNTIYTLRTRTGGAALAAQ